ncbi:2-oxoacid:acceptor oxidoreductase subunit alpha [bacterium]|nr:MAG: 2-oxoacid:acceptor oxidoreductase subunit alpha [bacterium]
MRGKYGTSKKDIAIVLGGEAGQGIQTIEFILARVLKRSGYHIFSTKEYMSRIRGGSNSILIRVSPRPVNAAVDRIDILVPLDHKALVRLNSRVTPETVIVGDSAIISPDQEIVDVPLQKIAEAVGDRIYANTAAVGLLSGILEADTAVMIDYIKEFFAKKSADVVSNNITAARKGYEAGRALCKSGTIKVPVDKDPDTAHDLLVNGAEAVAFGAIAGGCNFVSSYPMSPSTAVLTNLSAQDEQFGIIVEQAEDEISAVNMAIGAWYAGARAMATTSGGGFALMEEGISLAGMLESPLVVHLAQRPGPATGLPTRTEQGDLELALYAGHGEFPRIIYAPGNTEEAFTLTQRAFNVSDRYQVPVFILTDQYFMDTYYNVPDLESARTKIQKHVVQTDSGYRRYLLTEDGISPRGIPGFGSGLVTADSDEHDEDGHITEEEDVRTAMVDKRLRKLESILASSVPPLLKGPEEYRNLVIGWGSTLPIISEAIEQLDRNDTACLHFPQVYPLPPVASNYLKEAKTIIVVENNATAQFGRLLKIHTEIKVDHSVLKYSGMPFTVEELVTRIGELI